MKKIKLMLPCQGRKENLVSLVLRRKEETWFYGSNELGHYKKDCPKSNKEKRKKEDAHATKEVEELDSKKPKKEEVKDIYYDWDHLSL